MKKYLYVLATFSLFGALAGCDKDSDGESCVNDLDCPTGQDCVNQICVKPIETGCLEDAECGNYTCNQTTSECNATCNSEDQCNPGTACSDEGFCVGSANDTYSSVLLVSRTPGGDAGKEEGSCRAPNPGPDIDYVELISAGTAVVPTDASGAHGGSCGSAAMGTPTTPWALPTVALERLSIPDITPGECDIDNADKLYYFMGTGQGYESGETLAAGTGFLKIGFGQTFQDGDQIKVWEVNGSDGKDNVVTCDNVDTARKGDVYGLYLVSDQAPKIEAGTKLDAPHFIHVGDNIGVSTSPVVL